MSATRLPGTLWINRGRWNWRVKLPGSDKRKNYPLKLTGQRYALAESKGKDLAESLAWRMWEKAGKQAPKKKNSNLDDVCSEFLAWAETYYRRADGSPTRETVNCEIALRLLRARHGRTPVDDMTYNDILSARDVLIEKGLRRPTINQRVGIWKRFFAWALDNRKCQATTKAEVWAIGNLKRNRTPAPEGRQVMPVDGLDIEKTATYLPKSLRAMVRIQELSGMRPGEICALRPCDIEKREGVWIYRPSQHKTAHKNNVRVIVLGPRAQKALAPYIEGTQKKQAFSPALASKERQLKGVRRDRQGWTPSNYAQSVRYAIRRARKADLTVADWTPNQLRHTCGTRVRRQFGIEAARAVLGHSNGSRITDRYTRQAVEAEIIAAASTAMRNIG